MYDELRRLAAQQLARERPGHTLDPTALVHEAYLWLVGSAAAAPGEEPQWAGRRHFFAAAAEAMRRILIDNARRKRRLKHGGDRRRVALDAALPTATSRDDLVALDEALARFAQREPAKAELVVQEGVAGEIEFGAVVEEERDAVVLPQTLEGAAAVGFEDSGMS